MKLGEGLKILAMSGEKSILSGGLDGQSDLQGCRAAGIELAGSKNRKNSKKKQQNGASCVPQIHFENHYFLIFSFFLLFFSSPRESVAQSTYRRNAGRLAGLPRLTARSPASRVEYTGHTAEKQNRCIGISTPNGPPYGMRFDQYIASGTGTVQAKECIRKISINGIYGVWTVSVVSLLILF